MMRRSRPVLDVFLDESSYTGPDLVNREQPVFVLASTILSPNEAARVLDAHIGVSASSEAKHSKLSKSRRGRSQVVEVIRALTGPPRRISFYAVHKEYVLLALMIDFWLEPMMHEDGLNFYERGTNIGFVNVTYICLGAALGAEGRRELLRRFQVMTRDRTAFSWDSFWQSLTLATREHELVDKALGTLLVAERRLGRRHLWGLPSDLLDLGDYGLLDTVGFWRRQVPDTDFVFVHDRSSMIERNHATWEAIFDPDNPATVVGQDRRTISFPLPVRGLRLEDSRMLAPLQVADLVAGAAFAVFSARARNVQDEYADSLIEAGLLGGVNGGVWPSDAITPEELETDGPPLEDSAEFIATLLRDKRNETPNGE